MTTMMISKTLMTMMTIEKVTPYLDEVIPGLCPGMGSNAVKRHLSMWSGEIQTDTNTNTNLCKYKYLERYFLSF